MRTPYTPTQLRRAQENRIRYQAARLRAADDEEPSFIDNVIETVTGGGASSSAGINTQSGAVEYARRAQCAAMGMDYDQGEDQCVDRAGQPSTGGGSYGPSAADCAAAGADYDPNTGQCVAKAGSSTTGTGFKPIDPNPEGGYASTGEDMPPWVQQGIERCRKEGKLYDAASDTCVEDPCGEGKQLNDDGECEEIVGGGTTGPTSPPRYTGGLAKKTDKAEPWTVTDFLFVSMGVVAGGTAASIIAGGVASMAGAKRPLVWSAGAGAVGGIAGGVVAAVWTR